MTEMAFFITTLGNLVLAQADAGERQMTITRIMVGSGQVQTGDNPEEYTDLIHAEHEATCSTPEVRIVDDNGDPLPYPRIEMVVQYDNQMNGGLQTGFFIYEIGIFALNTAGQEVMMLYGTLGDKPQWVSPQGQGNLDVRQYPIAIAVSNDLQITTTFPTGAFVMWQDLPKIVSMTANATPPQYSLLHMYERKDVSASYAMTAANGKFATELRQYVNPKHPEQGYALSLPLTIAENTYANDGATSQDHLDDLHSTVNLHSTDIGYLLNAAANSKTLIMTVTLSNTEAEPLWFNNSAQTVAFPTGKNRNTLDYIVTHEVVSASDGALGEVKVSAKQLNGFTIAYTGSATAVTLKMYIQGGLL